MTFSRVPEAPRAPSGVRAFLGVIRSRLLAAAAAASAAAALTAAASSAFGVGLLGLGAFVSVMPALPAVVAFDVLQGLLVAALLAAASVLAVASFISAEASALRRRTLQSFEWSLGSFAAGSRVVARPLPAVARVSAVARVKLLLLLLQRN